ncbi:MAG: heme peroxidase family protein [Anaerolineales bacterium]
MSHFIKPLEIVAPRSKFYQGPFGRLFPELPAWKPAGVSENQLEGFLRDVAEDFMMEVKGKKPGDVTPEEVAIFSSRIPVGYTYLGQFIDHDITFDPASSLVRQNDPNGLFNHRTPRLDLDSLYGSGPSASPYLYDQEDKDALGRVQKLLVDTIPGTALKDLPRNKQGRALIGDARNDENAIVAQLQLAFLLAHNELVDRAREANLDDPFESARTTLRWLYQYIVWNDFLEQITQKADRECALHLDPTCPNRQIWKLGFEDVYSWRNQPFMPVEFSVAAYRFGHSMVRNKYQTNFPHRGFNVFAPIFDNTGIPHPDDLRGFRPLEPQNYVQWDWYLQMESSQEPFPQLAQKIDPRLANALHFLPEGAVGSPMNVLAFRNLMRGIRMDLPSGTDVAKRLGIPPLVINAPHEDSLWFYILKEADSLQEADKGQMLGRVGSIIVCATFAGLLKGDPSSYFNVNPTWKPDHDPLLKPDDKKDSVDWKLASIIRLSGLPVSAEDFPAQ